MKRVLSAAVVFALVLFLGGATLAEARGPSVYFGTNVWVGLGWWGPPYSYYPAPPVIIQPPPVYVQPAPLPLATAYWYYCPNPQGYYPYIQQCPNGWMQVVPPATPPGR